jgi:hypothetical protein
MGFFTMGLARFSTFITAADGTVGSKIANPKWLTLPRPADHNSPSALKRHKGRNCLDTYYDADADLEVLRDKTLAIVGYGNQGRSQALNLRDSGLKVVIGALRDESAQKAESDGSRSSRLPKQRSSRMSSPY